MEASSVNRADGHAWQVEFSLGGSPPSIVTAIWGSRMGEPASVLRFPGTFAGLSQQNLYLAHEGLSDLGVVAYAEGGTSTEFFNEGARSLWIEDQLIVAIGDSVAGMPGFTFSQLARPVGVYGGRMAFRARVVEQATGTELSAFFVGHDLAPVVQEGDVVSGFVMDDFVSTSFLNNAAAHVSPAGNHWLIWASATSGENVLVRDGSVAQFQGVAVQTGLATSPDLTAAGLPNIASIGHPWIDDQGEWGAVAKDNTTVLTTAVLERDQVREFESGTSSTSPPRLQGAKLNPSGDRVVLETFLVGANFSQAAIMTIENYPADLINQDWDVNGDGVADSDYQLKSYEGLTLDRLQFTDDQSLLLPVEFKDVNDTPSEGWIVRIRGHQLGETICSPAEPNSSGNAARMLISGSRLAGGNPLGLRGIDLPSGKPCLFLCSQTTGFVPMAGGSQGNLCLGGSILRFQDSIQTADALGIVTAELDTLAFPSSPPMPVVSGCTWTFQAWFRDQNPGSTSNFTDAVSVAFE